MAFKALGELLDEALQLPVDGTLYTVPAPSAAVGLRTQALINAAAVAADGGQVDEQVLGDAAERDLYRDVLGSAHDEMVAAGVTWPALKHCAITAMVWIAQDKEAAEAFWNAAGDPNRLASNRAARRNSPSGAASSTRSRGSTSGPKAKPHAKATSRPR
ncbi:hypothetical protein EYS09_14275 [Streptomyces kasugaensis]|uniref:DUF7426 domain-containing protein n=1 Tax=Streptomyces kasugaensis TaxID=1946 RepID=A0A4Q9HV69_STRKA|nr:hypothetical protein [Streptomyces kasugaensis]TBO59007.1 hypothetical protein EYS09_14275 [Streptomyces kasugaensis]